MRYSYRCARCGVFTVEQSIKDEPLRECPDCGTEVKRIIGKNINVLYRGSGFYSTDHHSSCPAAESGSGEACASCEHSRARNSD